MKESKDITIEKYYNDDVASIKDGVTENLISIKAIVVSVNEYPRYKFLIEEPGKITKVLSEEIKDTTEITDFKEIEEFEKDIMDQTSEGNEEGEKPIPGKIHIDITPKTLSITKKINIDYGNYSKNSQYKIGSSNTNWSEYTGEITVTSEMVLGNKWENEDKTVTLYVKGINEEGNECIEEYVIKNLDVNPPNAPVIGSNFGYPIITKRGIEYSNGGSIQYDTREDIYNYYSVDGGVTWKEYTGTIQITKTGTIMAKSVNKESGLTVETSKQVTIPTDALPIKCYDGNEETGESLSQAKIFVDKDMVGKNLRVLIYSYEGGGMIQYISTSGEIIREDNNICAGTRSLRWATITIPENIEYMVFNVNYGGSNLREIQVFDGLIPTLSSNIGPNGKVTCSSKYGDAWDGWIAFNDRNSGDGWYATSSPAWIQYEFNNSTTVKRIYIYAEVGSSNSNTTGITLQYSDDGINYNNAMNEYMYTIKNKTYINAEETLSAKFWRVHFTRCVRVYNLQFYAT